jgi:hypothetical protein
LATRPRKAAGEVSVLTRDETRPAKFVKHRDKLRRTTRRRSWSRLASAIAPWPVDPKARFQLKEVNALLDEFAS